MENQETQPQDPMNKFDGIEDALNVEASIIPKEEVHPVVKIDNSKDLKQAYEYSRGQLYNLIEKGQEAISGIMDVANQSDQPRAYEVAGQLIKHVGDVADKLVDLQKKVNDIENPKASKTQEVTNNTMFVGSTSDLAKFLKKKQDK